MTTVPLWKLAKTIRSKNAGPYYYTFDIIFDDAETYGNVIGKEVITRSLVASLFGVSEAEIVEFIEYPPGNALKFTMRRPMSSGDVGDSDVYGCQQYAPLLTIPVPTEDEQ